MWSGRTEVRLADAQIDDVAALSGKVRGAREHREGIFLADSIEGRDGAKHGPSSGVVAELVPATSIILLSA